MTKDQVNQIRIEVETSDEKSLLLILLDRDGTLNRKGSGFIDDKDLPFVMGMSDGSAFKTLIDVLDEEVLQEDPETGPSYTYDYPDKAGIPLTFKFVFLGEKPNLIVYEFHIGSESMDTEEGLFPYFGGLVSKAVELTDAWYNNGKGK